MSDCAGLVCGFLCSVGLGASGGCPVCTDVAGCSGSNTGIADYTFVRCSAANIVCSLSRGVVSGSAGIICSINCNAVRVSVSGILSIALSITMPVTFPSTGAADSSSGSGKVSRSSSFVVVSCWCSDGPMSTARSVDCVIGRAGSPVGILVNIT